MREFKNVSEIQKKIEECISTSVNDVNKHLICSYFVKDVKFLKTFVSISLGLARSLDKFCSYTEIDFICSVISRKLRPLGLSCRIFGVDFDPLVIKLIIEL